MKKELLSHWINDQLKLHTGVCLAKALGVSSQTVFKWRDQEVKGLSQQSLAAIADYKKQSVEDVCQWLDIPTPVKGLLVLRIERLEAEVKALKTLAA